MNDMNHPPQKNSPGNSVEKTRLLEKIKELYEKVSKMRSRITERALAKKDLTEVEKFEGEIFDFVKSLKEKYNNANEYLILHALSGSGYKGTISNDFTGDDSIEKFVNNLETKYP